MPPKKKPSGDTTNAPAGNPPIKKIDRGGDGVIPTSQPGDSTFNETGDGKDSIFGGPRKKKGS